MIYVQSFKKNVFITEYEGELGSNLYKLEYNLRINIFKIIIHLQGKRYSS